ncbi:Crp/Fnr family transcriptional regulator [Clostridium sp. JS66]|nr:Crp/Fnr family transcriptional regulator [Clostridium sp. JS66]WPC43428.1 Crp/Fnr family transcriptional regulator [Clostridium sp. JS66]
MYKELFDKEKQDEMRLFFLKELAPLGKKKQYKKSEFIDIEKENFIAIVIKGKVKSIICNSRGMEKVLYFLQGGEIFGEINYFVGGERSLIVFMEASEIALVNKEILNKFLEENSKAYNFFIHSIVRKYRISVLQMQDSLFCSSKAKIINAIYRMLIQTTKISENKCLINIPMTQQELANLVGCSRITVTRTLKYLKDEKIIEMRNKKIYVLDTNRLKFIVEE